MATVEAPVKTQSIIHNTLQHKQQEEEDCFNFAYQCKECQKGFSHKANMYKHKMTHKNDYQEHVSEEVENKNKESTNKQKKVNFSGLNACEKCGAVFLSIAMLEDHCSKNHKESSEIEIDEPGLNVPCSAGQQ